VRSRDKRLAQVIAGQKMATARSASMMPEQPDVADFTQSSLEYWLTIEFKNLVPSHRRPSGMYVMPAFDNMMKWYGVIIVHQGYYRKGVFKFTIDLPRNYPNERPKVTFLTPVYHPYVHANGQLDLSLAFKQWIPKKHFIIHVLQFMKKMFYKIDVLFIDSPSDAPNPEALELYRKDTIKFFHSAQRCVSDCEHYKFTNPRGCSIRFMPYEDKEEEYERAMQWLHLKDAEVEAEKEAIKESEEGSAPKHKPSSITSHVTYFVNLIKEKWRQEAEEN